jgi:hypothetical protein
LKCLSFTTSLRITRSESFVQALNFQIELRVAPGVSGAILLW